MKKKHFDELFNVIIDDIKSTRDQGQKEYAHDIDNVFANFERVAKSLDISREKALMTYALKHVDGINSWIKGHKSQREDVTGRIKDLIVYSCLLWAMVEENQSTNKMSTRSTFNPKTGEVSYQAVGDETL